MSAETIVEKNELPVWTVHGVNWHIDIPLDEMNAQFDQETQAYEAASMALMVFKGSPYARQDTFLVMDEEGEGVFPLLSTTMIVHLKGTDPNKGFVPFTYIVLANQGFYNESRKMEALLHQDLEAIKQDQIKNENARKALDEELKKLKNQLNPPKE